MQTQAIIIKKQNTGEYDQWVTCYTEEFGKLKTVAKSILKPNSIQALHLDIFNLVEFDLISGRGMPIITGAQVINSFRGVKNSLAKTAVAYFFAEAVDKMVFENDKDGGLWDFLLSFFGELNEDDASPIDILRQNQVRLLDVLGYFPETDSCKACGEKFDGKNLGAESNSAVAFNHLLGGVVCKKCFLSGQEGILINREDFELLSAPLPSVPVPACAGRPKLPWRLRRRPAVPSCQKARATSARGRSVLDGMFEYIAGSKFSSLELLNMIR